MTTLRRVSIPVMCTLAGCLLVISQSCRENDPRKNAIWGTVTYRGQAVPAGSITFIPDASQGNSGPAVTVPLENGRFDSRKKGLGHIGGPHKVRITGLTGKDSGDEFFPEGTLLFPDYETSADLPNGPSEQNFVVPDDWILPPSTPKRYEGP